MRRTVVRMHSPDLVLNGQLDEISGDIPGAASRYIEESLDGQAVAVWSTGASGDQNPIYSI